MSWSVDPGDIVAWIPAAAGAFSATAVRLLQPGRRNWPAGPRWGAVPEVFDPARQELAWARAELATLLTPGELGPPRATHSTPLHRRRPDPGDLGRRAAARPHRRTGAGARLRIRELHRLRPQQRARHRSGAGPRHRADAAALYPDADIRNESFADTRVADGSSTWRSATCRPQHPADRPPAQPGRRAQERRKCHI